VLRGGADSFQADARRLRLFAFEVFFLGTAIDARSLVLVLSEFVQSGPPWIGRRSFVPARALVAVGSALWAQALAILRTEGCLGQLGQDSFAHHLLQVDLAVNEGVGLTLVEVLFEGLEHLDIADAAHLCEASPTGALPLEIDLSTHVHRRATARLERDIGCDVAPWDDLAAADL
jgi:hypothetical protein